MIEGACPAHGELVTDSEKWTAEIRAAVTAATGERVWIEKVQLLTTTEANASVLRSESDPLVDLVQYIDGLSASEELAALLAEDVRSLKEKLPPEVFRGERAIGPDSPEAVSRLLEDAKGMLVQRLLASGVRK